ncbi:MAG TPA: prealbumin-like fold domain-containing protein [Nitrososphaeraceae archaeon]|nr:prealbumin-like fold domain-containing protein [Nitrososphaeraceae archaeon]
MDFRRIKFLLLKFKLMHFNLLSIFVLTVVFFGFVITFSFINQYFDEINFDDSKIADIIDRDNNNNNALAYSLNKNMSLSPNNTLSSSSLIIKKVDDQNNPIGGATFLITPNPFTNRSNLAITDDNAEDANRTSGIVLLPNVIPRQYTISEIVAPDGYIKDVSIKTVNVNTQSTSSPTTVTFEAYPLTSGSNRLEYTARFICGTITGEEGPLRPGRYNSDINIFNRQSFPISFFWKAVAASQEEEQSDSNFRIRSLEPGGSISLSCKDIQASIPAYANDTGEKFFEGIMTINVDLDSSVIGSISSSREGVLGTISEEESLNVLSVDAIYTVNALKVASREIVLQLIEYSINKEHESGKIPKDIISKILSVTVPIRTNETINPDQQVRNVLMKEFSLNLEESKRLDITIRNLSLGVGALDDNHALSLERINAYQPPSP